MRTKGLCATTVILLPLVVNAQEILLGETHNAELIPGLAATSHSVFGVDQKDSSFVLPRVYGPEPPPAPYPSIESYKAFPANLLPKPPKTKIGGGVNEQVVNNSDNPAVTGYKLPLSGDLGSPFALTTVPPGQATSALPTVTGCLSQKFGPSPQGTSNTLAQAFIDKYPEHVKSVAAIVVMDNGGPRLLGTGVLISATVMATAGHVLDDIQKTIVYGKSRLTTSTAFAVFDVFVCKFPTGIPATYNPSTDPSAVPIQINSAVFRSDNSYDAALIQLPNTNRPFVTMDGDNIGPKSVLAVIGIPGTPGGTDTPSPEAFVHNYSIKGLAVSLASDALPVTLRIGTGQYLGEDNTTSAPKGTFRIHIDTLGGNSGSPVFDFDSGKLVGIQFGSIPSPFSADEVGYNWALHTSFVLADLSAF